MEWSNWQNKKHFALYKNADSLNSRSHLLTWVSLLLQQNKDDLNKRVGKISPRRGKQQATKIINAALNSGDTIVIIPDLEEVIEEMENGCTLNK